MLDWLAKRLTPVKRETERWVDLARAIQSFWETHFTPEYDSMYRMHSIYAADADGVRRIVAELGEMFDPAQAEDSIPIAVAMWKLELAKKDTDYPIRAAINRIGFESSAAISIRSIVVTDPATGKRGRVQIRRNMPDDVWQMEIETVAGDATPDIHLQDIRGSGLVVRVGGEVIGVDESGGDIWEVTLTEVVAAPSAPLWLRDINGSRKVAQLQAEIADQVDGANVWQLSLGPSRYMSFEGVRWLPLYALESDGPYGTQFYHEYTGIPAGAYLTSRGVLHADLSQIDQNGLQRIEELVLKLKPLHICYDGMIFTGTDFSESFNLITEGGDKIIAENNDYIAT